MQRASHLIPKIECRKACLKRRGAIGAKRRLEAAERLFERFAVHPATLVLSFASFGSEVNLDALNRHLASSQRLVLPRRLNHSLALYLVEDMDAQLEGIGLKEPIPARCRQVHEVELALVPGLAFEPSGFRLGYGKGYYDRLLAERRASHAVGVGFLEQLMEVPRDPWDVPVDALFFG